MRVRSDASSPTCRPLCWLPASGAALLLAACGGGGSDTAPPPPSAITLTLGADDASLTWNKAFTLKVLANDSASRGALTLVSASTPAHGTVKVVGNEIEYTPAAGYVGSDSFSYTVKADDGVSASATASLKVLAALTLKGMVSDGPIANAQVTAKVGSQEFKTSADAQGAYSVTVQTDKPGDAVLLSASGVGAQSAVKLQSLLGDLASLAKQADKDGVLAPAQSNATLVSHYSTALAALVSEANGNKAPDSSAALDTLARQVAPDRLMDMATAIKLVVDKGVALPAGVSDTAALVQGPTAKYGELLAQQASGNASLLAATRKEVQAGAGLGSVFAPSQPVAMAYYIARLGSRSMLQIVYQPDGKAEVLMSGYAGAANWSSKDGETTVTLASPYSQTGYMNETIPGSNLQVEVRQDILGWKLRQLAGSPDAGSALVSPHLRTEIMSGPNKGQISSDLWDDPEALSFANKAKLAPFTSDLVRVGGRYSGIVATADKSGADTLEITGPDTGRLLRSKTELSWRVKDGEFVLKFGNAERIYRELRHEPDLNGKYLAGVNVLEGKPTDANVELVVDADPGASFKADGQPFVNKRWKHGFADNIFYEFSSGGAGFQVIVDKGVETKYPLSWSITAQGALRIQRGASVREWQLLRVNGPRLVVLEGVGGSATVAPNNWRVNAYVDASATATPAMVAAAEKFAGFWHFSCDGAGRSRVYEIKIAAPAKLHFARSIDRQYANADCTGSFTQSPEDQHKEASDYSTVTGSEPLADGRLRVFATDGGGGQSAAVLSADGKSFQIEQNPPSRWKSVLRLSSFAFPG